jgi:hypothetical protein
MDTIAQENVEYDVKGQMYMSGRQYNMASILNFTCDWCKASGFPYRHDADNGNDRYVFRFDLGQNWPVFSAKFIRKIAKHLGEEKKLAEKKQKTADIQIRIVYKVFVLHLLFLLVVTIIVVNCQLQFGLFPNKQQILLSRPLQ